MGCKRFLSYLNSAKTIGAALCPFQGCLPQLRIPSWLRNLIAIRSVRAGPWALLRRIGYSSNPKWLPLKCQFCPVSVSGSSPPASDTLVASENHLHLRSHSIKKYIWQRFAKRARRTDGEFWHVGKSYKQHYQSPLRVIQERNPNHHFANQIGN